MRTAIHIIYGDGVTADKQRYALEHAGDGRTLILLSELDEYQQYVGFNRNIQIGLSTDIILELDFFSYKTVIFEAYDQNEFEWFMGMTRKLDQYLDSDNKRLFILLNSDVNVKPTERVHSTEREFSPTSKLEGEKIKELVMQRVEKTGEEIINA